MLNLVVIVSNILRNQALYFLLLNITGAQISTDVEIGFQTTHQVIGKMLTTNGVLTKSTRNFA